MASVVSIAKNMELNIWLVVKNLSIASKKGFVFSKHIVDTCQGNRGNKKNRAANNCKEASKRKNVFVFDWTMQINQSKTEALVSDFQSMKIILFAVTRLVEKLS